MNQKLIEIKFNSNKITYILKIYLLAKEHLKLLNITKKKKE
jgi:hypothetical protein